MTWRLRQAEGGPERESGRERGEEREGKREREESDGEEKEREKETKFILGIAIS